MVRTWGWPGDWRLSGAEQGGPAGCGRDATPSRQQLGQTGSMGPAHPHQEGRCLGPQCSAPRSEVC